MNRFPVLARAEPLHYRPVSAEAGIRNVVLVFTMAANIPQLTVSGNTFLLSRVNMRGITFGVMAGTGNFWLLIVLSPGPIGFLAPMTAPASFSALPLQHRTLTHPRCFTDRPSNANLAGLTS